MGSSSVAVLETVARGTSGSDVSVPVSTLLDEPEAVVAPSGPFSGADASRAFSGADTAWTADEVVAVCDGAETVEAVDRSERVGRHST